MYENFLRKASVFIVATLLLGFNMSTAFASDDWRTSNNEVLNSPFNLLTPSNGAVLNLNAGEPSSLAEITWEASPEAEDGYIWMIGLASADLLNADERLLEIVATTNSLSLTYEDIDDLLNSNGISAGESANLRWTVSYQSFTTFDEIFANENFLIEIIRFDENQDFNLLTPADGFNADLNDLELDFEVLVTWEELDGTTEYVWHVGLAGADFTNPTEILESISAGTATELILTVEA
ncbi:MAG: SusE domain-containing protein, partial [Luteibaculaceae bacterium]